MNTKEAVMLVLKTTGLTKYALAKSLGMASSTSINQWLTGNVKMSEASAAMFEKTYSLKITDVFSQRGPLEAIPTSNRPS